MPQVYSMFDRIMLTIKRLGIQGGGPHEGGIYQLQAPAHWASKMISPACFFVSMNFPSSAGVLRLPAGVSALETRCRIGRAPRSYTPSAPPSLLSGCAPPSRLSGCVSICSFHHGTITSLFALAPWHHYVDVCTFTMAPLRAPLRHCSSITPLGLVGIASLATFSSLCRQCRPEPLRQDCLI